MPSNKKERRTTERNDVQKTTITNILFIFTFYAVDMIAIMLRTNSALTAEEGSILDLQLFYYAIVTFFLLVALAFVAYFSIRKLNVKRTRLALLLMIIVTAFNIVTFVFGGNVLSLIILIVPLLVLIYTRETVKRARIN
jgi:glucan phosphoethanolaminetransferase (alkaline phosphatase superfamily)